MIYWTSWYNLSQAKSRGRLGFRDFSSFNRALVAKQVWRMIQNPKSLAAKVLQATYFKHGNFVEATLGSNPSFTWRSILWGREVILKGYRWGIGDGNQVIVYKDNLIPRPITFKPIFYPTLPSDTTIFELIDHDYKWKKALLYEQFMKEDADVIMNIPLPNNPKNNQVLWHYDKKGDYSVKSGYQIVLKLNFPNTPSSS